MSRLRSEAPASQGRLALMLAIQRARAARFRHFAAAMERLLRQEDRTL